MKGFTYQDFMQLLQEARVQIVNEKVNTAELCSNLQQLAEHPPKVEAPGDAKNQPVASRKLWSVIGALAAEAKKYRLGDLERFLLLGNLKQGRVLTRCEFVRKMRALDSSLRPEELAPLFTTLDLG